MNFAILYQIAKQASVLFEPNMSLDVNISEPEEFNSNELHSSIKEIAELNGMRDFEYHVDFACGKGDNYIANIFRVLIKENGKEDNEISVIVKTLVNTARQELFHELHKREVNVYTEIVSQFKTIQNDSDIKERVQLPKCLFSSVDKGKEILILEDLKAKGFELDNKLARYENLDYTQVRLVITELAKFHSLSFIFEKKYAENYTKIRSNFEDIIFNANFLNKSKLRDYFFESYEMSLNVITNLGVKKRLETIQSKLLDIMKTYTEPKQYNVFCHGDCWINNVMFKHEKEKASKVCFLDFQAMRYANPVTDIMYFLYVCTDSKFRSENFEVLQKEYYDSLKSFLSLYDIEVNSVYPKKEFDNDIKETLPYGLLCALIELRITTTTLEDEAIMKGFKIVPGEDLSQVPGEVDLFKIKVNDVVTESLANGVLDRLVDKINH